jgi:hypothetical protein
MRPPGASVKTLPPLVPLRIVLTTAAMGFLDSLFGGDKPSQKNIDKLTMRVKERYAQPEYRREAMEKLLAWGTPDALRAVCQRFTVVVQSPHWDEEEKRWLVDELAKRGEAARSVLVEFLARADHIAFAARALQRLVKHDEYVQDLMTALKARAPEDHRSTQGKAELVAALAETGDARVAEALLPYLADHGDDVQCACVDAYERLWPKLDQKDGLLRGLQAVVVDDGRSARVLRHTAAAMQRLGLPIDATKPLAPAVAEDYVVKDGKLSPAHGAR